MSTPGRNAALEYGKSLPSFKNLEQATVSLVAEKDQVVKELLSQTKASSEIALDFTADSLLHLEKWYFDHTAKDPAKSDSEKLATACAYYFGEVVAHSLSKSHWVVEEYAFTPGSYTIGIRYESLTMNLSSFYKKLHHPLNKKRDSMWKTYQHYFLRNPKVTIRF